MKTINKMFDIILTFIFIMMIILVFIQVVNRYTMNLAIPWTEEMSRFLYIWLTFFGAVLVTRDKEQIKVDFILNKFNPKIKNVIMKINIFLIIIFLFAFTYGGFINFKTNLGSYAPTLSFIDIGYVTFILPLSGLLLLLFYIIRLFIREEEKQK